MKLSPQQAQTNVARFCALDPLRYVMRLDTLARIIRETAPAERPVPNDPEREWANGCASANERIANAIADTLDMRPTERAAFCQACGVADLKG